MEQEKIQHSLQTLYSEVHKRAMHLTQIHRKNLKCKRGCAGCCIDGLTVFEVEAENIRRNFGELLKDELPAEKGKCAFLNDEGACRIYSQRPYVCRTQGLPLRWFDEGEDDEIIEYRDICPLNEEGLNLEEMPPEECWSIGSFEERLAMLQSLSHQGNMTRLALRDLFNSRRQDSE